MADESSGLLFQILLDQAAQQDTERGLSNIEQKIGNFDKLASKAAQDVGASWDSMSQDFQKFTAKFDERFKLVNGKLVDLETGTKVAASTLRDFSKINVDAPSRALGNAAENAKKLAQYEQDAKTQEAALAREMRAVGREAGLTEDQVRELPPDLYDAGVAAAGLHNQMSKVRSETFQLSRLSGTLSRTFQPLLLGGTAFIAGVALQARSYSKFIEDAGIKGDETANKWIAASKRVKNAQLNLGEVSAQALLPVYEELAKLAEKAASFARENPDLIKAGLSVATVAATVGAIGLAVSKGIRFYADLKFIAATTEYTVATGVFQKSVHEFLAGATLSGAGGGAGTAVGGALAKAGRVATIATLAVTELVLATTATNALLDAVGAPRLQEMFKAQADFLKGIPDVLSGKTKLNDLAAQVVNLAQASADARKNVGDLGSNVRDFQKEADLAQATDAFISYRQQEAQAEQQYSQQRASLVQQGLEQINQIEANYVKQRSQLIAQYEQSSANAVASFNFQQAQAASQFAQQQAQAEQQYHENRKKAQESYQKESQRAARDHQKALRKLEEDHADKVRDLVAARDALGLSREKRDFERRKRDLEEGYNEEKKRRQEDQRQRLREMDEQFAKERAQRQADFEFRQQQAAEQFAFQQAQAKAQFEERLKQLDAQHNEEVSKARQQQAEKLRELELAYRQEQVTRRNAFLDILRDLNANLLNEENLRNQYYARMQADLVNFLQSTASGVGNGSNLPGYQSGGYTPEGPIRTHLGEWVADKQSTRTLEKLVGGRLTRDSIQTFAQGGGSTTVNMHFPGGYVTQRMLNESLDRKTAKFLKDLTKGLVRA